jgi:hypothetical protein
MQTDGIWFKLMMICGFVTLVACPIALVIGRPICDWWDERVQRRKGRNERQG